MWQEVAIVFPAAALNAECICQLSEKNCSSTFTVEWDEEESCSTWCRFQYFESLKSLGFFRVGAIHVSIQRLHAGIVAVFVCPYLSARCNRLELY